MTMNARSQQGGKKNNKNGNGLTMSMLLDNKVPLNNMLDLCPRFKKKVLKAWAAELSQEIEGMEDEVECNITQPEDVPRTRDDNVAKVRITIATKDVQGVILDGG